MDSSDVEYDMLDLLAWNMNQLASKLKESNTEPEKKNVLSEYIRRLDQEFKEINDFNDDLDWFNVSEPLTVKNSLRGKIVVLDFFTYCCINCMHILPELKRLEKKFSIEDGLVVIGVHSAKFENEKETANISSAVQRYDITHPVVNDPLSSMWMDLHIKCWPTLLVLGPSGKPLFVFMGEGHYDTLTTYVSAALEFYSVGNVLKYHTLPLKLEADPTVTSNLKFPGKITCSKIWSDEKIEDTEVYAISDSGNHRILLINPNGQVLEKIGGKTSGFTDGNFITARFNSPQGVTFYSDHLLYVADTENHAIRLINLKDRTVTTIAGTGKQGSDQSGGLIGTAQEISSPWDVATYRTKDMDMSFHIDEESIPEKDLLLIAMAGTHQIWSTFIDEIIWWKFKKFAAGSVAAIAGNGHEENRNNSYPNNAAFAQPSGLAISIKLKELYIADSESSTVRKLQLDDGKVLPVVGGDRNPLNLFAFGDVDGTQLNAKLQHPLGVAFNSKEHCLYVADTYNHKIKKVDLNTNASTTCNITKSNGSPMEFNEPGGLCVSPQCDKLYIANTNNHTIEIVSLDDLKSETLKLQFNLAQDDNDCGTQLKWPTILEIHSNGAKIQLVVNLQTVDHVKFTVEAPQKWTSAISRDNWTLSPANGSLDRVENKGLLKISYKLSIELTAPPILDGEEKTDLTFTFKLSLCAVNSDVCYPKAFSVRIPIVYSEDGAHYIQESSHVTVSEADVHIT